MSRIKHRRVYRDKKSKEWGSRTKLKHKIAGYKVPFEGVGRIFWVLTSQEGRTSGQNTVTIEQHHWENKSNPMVLTKTYSYASPGKYEILKDSEVLAKRRDARNGFSYMACLCQEKFDELCSLTRKLKMSKTRTVQDLRNIAASTVPQEKVDDILKQLHL